MLQNMSRCWYPNDWCSLPVCSVMWGVLGGVSALLAQVCLYVWHALSHIAPALQREAEAASECAAEAAPASGTIKHLD